MRYFVVGGEGKDLRSKGSRNRDVVTKKLRSTTSLGKGRKQVNLPPLLRKSL